MPRIFEGGGRYFFAAYFAPSMQLMLCLSVCVVLFCLLASTSKARDVNKGNNKQDRQTSRTLIARREQKFCKEFPFSIVPCALLVTDEKDFYESLYSFSKKLFSLGEYFW